MAEQDLPEPCLPSLDLLESPHWDHEFPCPHWRVGWCCHYAAHVQHWYYVEFMPRGHYPTADVPSLWLLQSVPSLFREVPRASSVEVVLQCMSWAWVSPFSMEPVHSRSCLNHLCATQDIFILSLCMKNTLLTNHDHLQQNSLVNLITLPFWSSGGESLSLFRN